MNHPRMINWQNQLSSLRRIGFDTNALIYILEDREPYATYVSQAFRLMERGHLVGVISTIVELEILVKPMRDRDDDAQDRVETFLQQRPNLSIRPVDRMIARRAANIRARTRLLPMDAIIVATAVEERCDAIIGNDSMMAARTTDIPYLYLNDYV